MSNYCNNCALRLFNTKCYNLNGLGETCYNNMIVVPNVDFNAYKNAAMSFSKQVEVINKALLSTGELAQSYIYITPLIKCKETNNCEINEDILVNCSKHLKEELYKYHIKHVLLLGSSVRRILHTSISTLRNKIVISYKSGIMYYSSYAPLSFYTDTDLYNKFEEDLLKFYSSCRNKDYSEYELMWL